MISYQDGRILDECLASVRNQTYGQKLIDILLVDGGSTDRTLEIARKYGAKVISRPDLTDQPQVRGGIALSTPTTDLVMPLSADNRLQERDALARMVETFADEEIVGCCTWRYGLRKSDPALSRYFALIGGNDPIAVGLGKADRGPLDARAWHTFGNVEDRGGWYQVSFEANPAKVPTLGMNGFIFRRRMLEKSQFVQYATHIDICLDLIRQGHNRFAFVKNRHVVHFIDVGVFPFLKRRLLYAQIYSEEYVPRIYNVFQKRDFPRLMFIIVFYPTLIVPLLRALKGYWVARDSAWFLHPLMCAIFTVGYSFHFMKKFVVKVFGGKRQLARTER